MTIYAYYAPRNMVIGETYNVLVPSPRPTDRHHGANRVVIRYFWASMTRFVMRALALSDVCDVSVTGSHDETATKGHSRSRRLW